MGLNLGDLASSQELASRESPVKVRNNSMRNDANGAERV
jgi:hypothetical protein